MRRHQPHRPHKHQHASRSRRPPRGKPRRAASGTRKTTAPLAGTATHRASNLRKTLAGDTTPNGPEDHNPASRGARTRAHPHRWSRGEQSALPARQPVPSPPSPGENYAQATACTHTAPKAAKPHTDRPNPDTEGGKGTRVGRESQVSLPPPRGSGPVPRPVLGSGAGVWMGGGGMPCCTQRSVRALFVVSPHATRLVLWSCHNTGARGAKGQTK